MVTKEVLDLARAGKTQLALAALKLPPKDPWIDLLREVARDGWETGLDLGVDDTKNILGRGTLEAGNARRARDRRSVERFAEQPALRALRDLLKGKPVPQVVPRDLVTRDLLNRESRRVLGSVRRIVADAVRAEASSPRRAAIRNLDRPLRIEALLDEIRIAINPQSIIRTERLQQRAVSQAVAEVDWEGFQRGHTRGAQSTPAVAGFQWITGDDAAVTCVCQIFDRQTIIATDPELEFFAPRLHFN